MRIAFLHYHLRTGGVTTVLKGQVAAVRRFGEALALTGDGADTTLPCPVLEIPELGYDRPGVPWANPQTVAEKTLRALRKIWPGGCDLLHVHNPTLAKNRGFLKILKHLQNAGVALFLQIHDFAEDGRPSAYFQEPYPQNCHYGVINTRDEAILTAAGIDPGGLHRLPNAVHPLPVESGPFGGHLVLYPVRAIRRKNQGEAILLSLFLKRHLTLAVTQPPNSPEDWPAYRDWKAFVKAHRLGVAFEVARKRGFAQLVAAAESMVTTSITEGFGLAFLEPWTAGKQVWGRKLDDICRDFQRSGVSLDGFYDRLAVPLEWLDGPLFSAKWRSAVVNAAAAYGRTMTGEELDRGWCGLTRGGTVDFGILDEKTQRGVIGHLLNSRRGREELVERNPWLADPGAVVDPPGMIAANRRAVAERYGWKAYGERLEAIYRRVTGQSVRHRIDKTILLKAFMDLERFSLLKWCPYNG